MHSEKVIQVTSSYFCAGIVVKNGIIIDAAPIIKYMIGWDGKKFKEYCLTKKFTYR